MRLGFEELPCGRVLVLAPHADDEVLGVGGTIARHTARGDCVEVIVLTDGVCGTLDGAADSQLLDRRVAEARRGLERLRVTDVDFWGLPEGHAPDDDVLATLAMRLAMRVASARPEVVYAPWIGEEHRDHHQAARLARLGLALAGFEGFALGYEVWTPLEPEWVVDVSSVWERKLAALDEHASQLAHTDLHGLARANAARRGPLLTHSGVPSQDGYAEAFADLGPPAESDCDLLAALSEEAA